MTTRSDTLIKTPALNRYNESVRRHAAVAVHQWLGENDKMIKLATSNLDWHYRHVAHAKKRVMKAYNKVAWNDHNDEVHINHYIIFYEGSDCYGDHVEYFCIRNENIILAVYALSCFGMEYARSWPKSVEDGTAMTYWSYVRQQNSGVQQTRPNSKPTRHPANDDAEIASLLDELDRASVASRNS